MVLLKGKGTTCSQCGDANITMIMTPDDIYCECVNGHYWREPYEEQGGSIPQAETPARRMEDILTDEEITLYQTIIETIGKDIYFYINANPAEKYKKLSEICHTEQRNILTLFKKITLFNNAMKGG